MLRHLSRQGVAKRRGFGQSSVIGDEPEPLVSKTSMGGHAPGHVRDAFLSAIEAYADWNGIGPEPTVEFEVHYEPRPIPISKACGLVWNCTDILPGGAWDELIGNDVLPGRRTYAAAARALLAHLRA
jgi:hypothetical protein